MDFLHNDFTTIKKKTIIFNIYFDELKETYITKINNLTLEAWYKKYIKRIDLIKSYL